MYKKLGWETVGAIFFSNTSGHPGCGKCGNFVKKRGKRRQQKLITRSQSTEFISTMLAFKFALLSNEISFEKSCGASS
jgi:hypothetical protein